MPTSSTHHADAPRNAFNGLVFALIVCSVALGATTGWMRYSAKRASGFKDGAEQVMGELLPDVSLVGGWNPGGAATCRLICPQCGSYCMTLGRGGSLLGPFCKQVMVQESPVVLPVAGIAPGTTAPIPIQAGVKAKHDNRGPCANCHTVVRAITSGLAPAIQAGIASPHRNRGACTICHSVVKPDGRGPVPAITPDSVAAHPDRGMCTNCHIVTQLNAAAFTPAAAAMAPPISADAVKPILIKPFGAEVCPAPGEGAKVTGVMGNSNASKAGLAAGDVIVEINGKKVADADGLLKLVTAAAPEANVQLKIVRSGRLQKVAVLVGEGEMEGSTPIPNPKL